MRWQGLVRAKGLESHGSFRTVSNIAGCGRAVHLHGLNSKPAWRSRPRRTLYANWLKTRASAVSQPTPSIAVPSSSTVAATSGRGTTSSAQVPDHPASRIQLLARGRRRYGGSLRATQLSSTFLTSGFLPTSTEYRRGSKGSGHIQSKLLSMEPKAKRS